MLIIGLERPPFNRKDLREVYKHGFKRRLWHPEYHARSHFDFKKWINLMKSKKDLAALECFKFDLVCATIGYDLRSENTMFDSFEEQFNWFKGGIETFEKIWGYKPTVHSSPHNVSGKYLADIVKMLDFYGVDNPIPNISNNNYNLISTIDRARFDPFSMNFNYETTWKKIQQELEQKNYIVLAYHAQNTFTEMYTRERHQELMDVIKKTIQKLREFYPHIAFVTSGELHQILMKGWSMEVWSDSFIFRNYNPQPVIIKIKNLKNFYSYGADWNGKFLELVQLSGPEDFRRKKIVEVGDIIELEPNSIYEIHIEGS